MGFEGRVALVTGAARGLGAAYVAMLARSGCRVVANDLDSMEGGDLQALVRGLRAEGLPVRGVGGSVSDRAAASAMVEAALSEYGRLDIVINNAGFLRDRSFRKMDLDDFDAIIDVHLRGAAHVTHAAWPHLCDQGYGRVLLTTSTSALYGAYGQANYDAAKLGLVGLQNALKLEGERFGVTVNTIAPLAATRLGEGIFPEAIKPIMGQDWVAAVALHLVSEACSESGLILEVGAGHVARVRIVENSGATLAEPTLEAAAKAVAAALAPGQTETGFGMAAEAVAKVLSAGRRRPETFRS